MNERRQQVISQAQQVFMRYGIKSVTMDDMARNLGMSKKTLYQFVTDKNDLVTQVLELHCSDDLEMLGGIADQSMNAIDETFEIGKTIAERLRNIHPSIHFDLQKYHTEAWHRFRVRQMDTIFEHVSQNMKKGIAEGLYRDDLNITVLAKLYIARFDVVFDSEIYPPTEFNFAEVYLECVRYHIRGIASDKGISYLQQKLQKENQI